MYTPITNAQNMPFMPLPIIRVFLHFPAWVMDISFCENEFERRTQTEIFKHSFSAISSGRRGGWTFKRQILFFFQREINLSLFSSFLHSVDKCARGEVWVRPGISSFSEQTFELERRECGWERVRKMKIFFGGFFGRIRGFDFWYCYAFLKGLQSKRFSFFEW